MKKIAIFISFIIILSGVFTIFANAAVYNWFFKAAPDHKQPLVFGGNKMPDKYGAVYIGPSDEKVVYLTFDAGYINENAVKILDILKEQDVKATFFILPAVINLTLDVALRMGDEGHIVANHSFSHKNMTQINYYDDFMDEIVKLENLYFEKTGRKMARLFRPPEGAFSEKTLEFSKKADIPLIFWSFAYADWDNGKQPDTDKAKAKILDNAHNGMVMLLHPTSLTNALILEDVIITLKQEGYRFGLVDELVEKA